MSQKSGIFRQINFPNIIVGLFSAGCLNLIMQIPALADDNCGAPVTLSKIQSVKDDEFVFRNKAAYEFATRRGGERRDIAHNTGVWKISDKKDEVFECDNDACTANSALILQTGHVFQGEVQKSAKLYICSSPILGNDKWKQYNIKECSRNEVQSKYKYGSVYGDKEYILYSTNGHGYCYYVSNTHSTATKPQESSGDEFQLGEGFYWNPNNDESPSVSGDGISDSAVSGSVTTVSQSGKPQNTASNTTGAAQSGDDGADSAPAGTVVGADAGDLAAAGAAGAEAGDSQGGASNTTGAAQSGDGGADGDPAGTVVGGNEAGDSQGGASSTTDASQSGGDGADGAPTTTVVGGNEAGGAPQADSASTTTGQAETPPATDEQSVTQQRELDAAEIAELQENVDAMREREQSLANRMVGGASMGAMGIGGTQVASALAEQNADADAERDMAAYLATFKCDYGAGMTITGGETGIVLPGANVLLPIYNEYTTLAADLKTRKESLGMAPGIESEVILDAATSGLYDNVSTGITDGAYASISRALSNPTGSDAAEWAAQRAETASQLTTGAIVAGAGALVGIAGNVLTNYVGDKPREMSDEIISEYDAKRRLIRTELAEVEQESETEALASAPTVEPGKEPSTAETNCESDDGEWNGTTCICPGDKIWNEKSEECEDPEPSESQTRCQDTGGTWDGNDCDCGGDKTWNDDTGCIPNVAPTPNNPEIVTINTAALFEKSGSFEITKPNSALNAVIEKLKGINFAETPATLVLVAHTDSDKVNPNGSLPQQGINDNKDLAERRADSVKTYLKASSNWPANLKIDTIAAGDQCAKPNPTAEDKKLDRKVRIFLFYNGSTQEQENYNKLKENPCTEFNDTASGGQ